MKLVITADELSDKGLWKEFAARHGYDEWALGEGRISGDEEFTLCAALAQELGLLPEEFEKSTSRKFDRIKLHNIINEAIEWFGNPESIAMGVLILGLNRLLELPICPNCMSGDRVWKSEEGPGMMCCGDCYIRGSDPVKRFMWHHDDTHKVIDKRLHDYRG